MYRRHVLVGIGGVGIALAGCLGQESDAAPSTDSPTSSHEEFGYCPKVPDGYQVEVPPWPDKPDSLTRETVKRFVTRFEEAFRARLALPKGRDDIEAVRVSASASDDEVTQTDGGWLVQFLVGAPRFVLQSPTPSPQGDPGARPVSYFVSDDAVFRSERTVDPRESAQGVKLNCHRTESSGG